MGETTVRDMPLGPAEKLQMALVQAQKWPGAGVLFRMYLKWRGVQIPPCTFDVRPWLPHVGPIVVHERTRIGRDVQIFHNVTIGRADIWRASDPEFEGFEICDGAVLCAGAVLVARRGTLVVGKGAVVGANAVLRESIGDWEIWAGNPAVKVGERQP